MLHIFTRMAKTNTIPLAIASDLHREIKRGARETGLSQADVMRQSIRLGLPRFVTGFPKPNKSTTRK